MGFQVWGFIFGLLVGFVCLFDCLPPGEDKEQYVQYKREKQMHFLTIHEKGEPAPHSTSLPREFIVLIHFLGCFTDEGVIQEEIN